jgi:predicted GNAT family acetyltransferase
VRAARHSDLASFRARVEPWLLEREAENNLLLGLLASPPRTPAPVLILVEDASGAVVGVALQTPPYNLIVAQAPAKALDAILDQLDGDGLAIPGVNGPNVASRHVAQAWAARHHAVPELQHAMRVFENRQLIPPRAPAGGGRARLATVEDLPVILSWSTAFARDTRITVAADEELIRERVRRGSFWLWETERPVSMAAIARRTPNGAAVGYVYTPDELRGRGYASAVTAALTEAELAGGHSCFLYTDLANPTSNKIYQAIGYRPICDVEEWRFAR